jgi:hypothetical protein
LILRLSPIGSKKTRHILHGTLSLPYFLRGVGVLGTTLSRAFGFPKALLGMENGYECCEREGTNPERPGDALSPKHL